MSTDAIRHSQFAIHNSAAGRADICENRHGGNTQSVAAGQRNKVNATEQRAWCLRMIAQAGARGLTVDELSVIASNLLKREIGPNRISGRISELKAVKQIVQSAIEPTRATRTGSRAAVMVVPQSLAQST